MKYKEIQKVAEGRFINRYNIMYEMDNGKELVYEMVSRDKEIPSYEALCQCPAAAAVMIMHDATGEKILLNREFRAATGQFVYSFPAGLIEPGESPEEGARRELWEETGLSIVEIKEWLPESYVAVGFSNEKNITCIGVAEGEFAESTNEEEIIQAAWYTKEQVRQLLKEKGITSRTQAYCYLWSRDV